MGKEGKMVVNLVAGGLDVGPGLERMDWLTLKQKQFIVTQCRVMWNKKSEPPEKEVQRKH